MEAGTNFQEQCLSLELELKESVRSVEDFKLSMKIEQITWTCSKCEQRYLKSQFELHLETGVCTPQEFEEYAGLRLKVWHADIPAPEVLRQAWESHLVDLKLESRKTRNKLRPETLKRSSNKLVMLAFERHIADNVLRKAKAMDLEEERVQLVRLKLDILRNQLLQFLENEEVGELERVEYFEDMEVIADKLLNELVFSWRCSVRNSGY